MTFTVQALSEATWPAFADLVERQGFQRVAQLGQHHWLVSRHVDAAHQPDSPP